MALRLGSQEANDLLNAQKLRDNEDYQRLRTELHKLQYVRNSYMAQLAEIQEQIELKDSQIAAVHSGLEAIEKTYNISPFVAQLCRMK